MYRCDKDIENRFEFGVKCKWDRSGHFFQLTFSFFYTFLLMVKITFLEIKDLNSKKLPDRCHV